MRKVIFLDVDGVLNIFEGGIDTSMVDIFRRIKKETGADVILSSTWRLHERSRDFIKQNVCEFFDCTPNLPDCGVGTDSTQRRGVEIKKWLDEHTDVEKYAILDDTGIMLRSQLPNYFQTSGRVGLTNEIADKVIEHLK